MARATNSLPVPLSPVIKAVASEAGELADELEDALHRFAATDDADVVILGFEQRLVRDDLLHVARGFERAENNLLELGDVERFEEIIVSAELHRFDGRLGRAVSGHHDDRQLGIDLADAAECFQAGDPAHANVHDHQVGLDLRNEFESLLATGRRGQFDFGRIENAPERILHIRLVIYQEELFITAFS